MASLAGATAVFVAPAPPAAMPAFPAGIWRGIAVATGMISRGAIASITATARGFTDLVASAQACVAG